MSSLAKKRARTQNYWVGALFVLAALGVCVFLYWGHGVDANDRKIASTIDVAPLMAEARLPESEASEQTIYRQAVILCQADSRVSAWGICADILAKKAKAEALKERTAS